jgi:hypothetical protein
VSNTLAIAAVTEAFRTLVGDVSDEAGLDTLATASPPDLARKDATRGQLNLFLYQITPNPGWANEDLPTRDSSGALVSQPTLALDLHYLLTAYGKQDSELDAHHVLGHGMSVIHDNGAIPREVIRAAVAATGSPIASADLADQIEMIRLSPERLSDEDMFRLWTVFQAKFRVSVGYCASVVLIERPARFRKAPPVRQMGGTGITQRAPLIEEVSPQPMTVDDTLVLDGERLDADLVVVRLAGEDHVVRDGGADQGGATVTPTRIEMPLPADLRAGPLTTQVLHGHELNLIEDTRSSFESAPVPFLLSPKITSSLPASATHASGLTLELAPPVTRTQRVVALLGDVALARDLPPFDPSDPNALDPVAEVHFDVPSAVANGSYLLRVQVDGAESALETNASGVYDAPRVTVS